VTAGRGTTEKQAPKNDWRLSYIRSWTTNVLASRNESWGAGSLVDREKTRGGGKVVFSPGGRVKKTEKGREEGLTGKNELSV